METFKLGFWLGLLGAIVFVLIGALLALLVGCASSSSRIDNRGGYIEGTVTTGNATNTFSIFGK